MRELGWSGYMPYTYIPVNSRNFKMKTILIRGTTKGRYRRIKRDYVGKIPKLGGGGLTQTHFLMSTYQVIFGMPK